MFKNVLVGVDGSTGGRDAIALARLLSYPSGKLTLVFVRSSEIAEDVAESEELLERERSAADLDADLLSVLSLNPGRGLHEQAERRGADLLVVGSCSHGSFGRAMLSDDTRAALNGAPCAVAVAARGYARAPHGDLRPRRRLQRLPGERRGARRRPEARGADGARVHALEVVSLLVRRLRRPDGSRRRSTRSLRERAIA